MARLQTTVLRVPGWLAELVSPTRCAGCEAIGQRSVLCPQCLATVVAPDVQRRAGFTVYAPLGYGGVVKSAIHRMKYSDRPDLCLKLGQLLGECLTARGIGPEHVLVPVPLHARRLASRGYNQAALLARAAARVTRSNVGPRWLRRVRDTPQQASLRAEARQTNVRGAFECRASVEQGERGEQGEHGRIVIVDDVITTGETASACARVLIACGLDLAALAALAVADPSTAKPDPQ